ncbi:hypothetical protein [Falsirhodobacter sp. 1013]|uniref:hypothetical protein n=1 Tax=Falsirhodobacter sp. 1013 TaxID=3417566 RepID=UPI003EB92870
MRARLNTLQSLLRRSVGFLAMMDREGRGVEYHMTKVLFFMGLILLMPEDTLSLQTYKEIAKYGFSEMVFAVFLIGCALIRFAALYVDGYLVRTPRWRASTSFCSCMLFGMLSYNVWFDYWAGMSLGPGFLLAIFPSFIVAEFRAASRLRWERIHHAAR